MSKEKEKRIVRILYVQQNKTAKECAELTGVTEKTIGNWVEQYGWKKERDTRNLSASGRLENIREIIAQCAEERMALQLKLQEAEKNKNKEEVLQLRQQMNQVSDEASKWNKALNDLKDSSKISLEVYLHVMERIFQALQNQHPDIFSKLIEFQETHIYNISTELS